MSTFRFQDLWIAQAIRQKEEHWGPLEDQAIMLKVKADPHLHSIDQKIMSRAQLLAQREGLTRVIQQWSSATKIALWILVLFAIISGATLAFNALDTQQRHVNILVALAALLGLHFITFLLWLLSFFASWQQQSLLARAWLWISKKLARSPDSTLAMQAFIHTANKGMRWIVSSISHGFWLIALVTAAIVFLALLASQHYSFGWETTILSSQTFVHITQFLGSIPALFGFPSPSTELITQSNNQIATITDAQKIWSIWLTGQLLVWGILLRLVCLIFCLIKARHNLAQHRLDIESPAYATLVNRFSPSSEKIGLDSLAPRYELPEVNTQQHAWETTRLIVGIELPPQQSWPLMTLHSSVTDAGKVETREERHQLLARLSQHPVQELLIVCNGQQTPDRGIAYFIRDISQYAQHTKVYLHIHNEAQSRLALWEKSLTDMGIPKEDIWQHTQQLFPWSA